MGVTEGGFSIGVDVILGNCTIPFFFFFFFFNLTYSRWSQRIFPSLPGSRLSIFLSRCKFSTLTTRQQMVEFYFICTYSTKDQPPPSILVVYSTMQYSTIAIII